MKRFRRHLKRDTKEIINFEKKEVLPLTKCIRNKTSVTFTKENLMMILIMIKAIVRFETTVIKSKNYS